MERYQWDFIGISEAHLKNHGQVLIIHIIVGTQSSTKGNTLLGALVYGAVRQTLDKGNPGSNPLVAI